MTIKDLQVRIDQLVAKAEAALSHARTSQYSTTAALPAEEWAELRAAGLAFIEATFGLDHSYYREFDKGLENSFGYHAKYALGVLTAIRDQLHGGWIETTRGLVSLRNTRILRR